MIARRKSCFERRTDHSGFHARKASGSRSLLEHSGRRNRLRDDRPAYTTEKETIAATCADAIDTRYPGFKDAIEVTDVATPLTFERYTVNWKGAFMTWMLSPDFQRKYGYVRKTVRGLDNLYIASMWTVPPGGIPGAAMAGREVAQMLCARDGKRFVTTKPLSQATESARRSSKSEGLVMRQQN